MAGTVTPGVGRETGPLYRSLRGKPSLEGGLYSKDNETDMSVIHPVVYWHLPHIRHHARAETWLRCWDGRQRIVEQRKPAHVTPVLNSLQWLPPPSEKCLDSLAELSRPPTLSPASSPSPPILPVHPLRLNAPTSPSHMLGLLPGPPPAALSIHLPESWAFFKAQL